MNRRRALSLLTAFAAVMALTVGSGAFTAMEAERGVSIDVVSDDNAFVGYDNSTAPSTVKSGEDIDLIRVENRFTQDVTITDVAVSIKNSPDGWEIAADDSSYGELDFDENAATTVEGTVNQCSPGSTETVQVDVTVSGTGVWARVFGDVASREFEVTCEQEKSVDGVDFRGSAGIIIKTTGLDPVDINYWTTKDEPGNISVSKTENVTVETNTKNPLNLEKEGTTIVAVEIPEYGVIYSHPNYDADSGEVNNWGSGEGEKLDEFP